MIFVGVAHPPPAPENGPIFRAAGGEPLLQMEKREENLVFPIFPRCVLDFSFQHLVVK